MRLNRPIPREIMYFLFFLTLIIYSHFNIYLRSIVLVQKH